MSSHRLPFQKSAQPPRPRGNVEQLWSQADPSLSTSSLSDTESYIYQIRTNSLVHSADIYWCTYPVPAGGEDK